MGSRTHALLRARTWLLAIALGGAGLAVVPVCRAHLARWGSWDVTFRNLMRVFPTADPAAWQIKRGSLSERDVKVLERKLGFELYPEDRQPEFFVARNVERELVGVAMFIDPRTQKKIVRGRPLVLEVGVGVDTYGRISRVRVFDYAGNPALTEPAFLDQLRGRTMESSFEMGEAGLRPVIGEEEESQLVANAAREALLIMKVVLGRR